MSKNTWKIITQTQYSDWTYYFFVPIIFRGWHIASEGQLNLIKQGVEKWNLWRDQNTDIKPDLSQADLRETQLQKVNLSNANLDEAKLQFSNLTGANLQAACLKKVRFQEANLQSANLKNADLSGAGMLEANLQYADLENANLGGAQFNEDALFNQTNLKRANLTGTTGLSSSQINLAITDKQTRLPDYLEEEMDDDFLLQM